MEVESPMDSPNKFNQKNCLTPSSSSSIGSILNIIEDYE